VLKKKKKEEWKELGEGVQDHRKFPGEGLTRKETGSDL